MLDEKFDEEFFVAVNGPSLGHCDNVIEKSMNNCQKYQDGTFFRTCVMKQLKNFNGNKRFVIS